MAKALFQSKQGKLCKEHDDIVYHDIPKLRILIDWLSIPKWLGHWLALLLVNDRECALECKAICVASKFFPVVKITALLKSVDLTVFGLNIWQRGQKPKTGAFLVNEDKASWLSKPKTELAKSN
ncbi:hypothetical protein MHU86_10132 [Fragilaria crotonensis]|nr:hypothetical protein MHU86_10132 [Fragilaria crotonensis]